jgi:hypothetical protein
MFEKIGRLAEAAANNISMSRRGFLGRLGHGALASAGVLGGLLALSNKAQGHAHTLYACSYRARYTKGCLGYNKPPHYCGALQSCGSCPQFKCCALVSKTIVGTC